MTQPFMRILVPVDFERGSRRAVRFARSLARGNRASIALAHVMPNHGLRPSDDRWWNCYAARTLQGMVDRAKLPGDTSAVILRGATAGALVAYAEEHRVDLIVISARDKPSWNGSTLGSTAVEILRHAHVPVLVLPPAKARAKAA